MEIKNKKLSMTIRWVDSEWMPGVCLASWMEPQLCPDGVKTLNKNKGESNLRTGLLLL